MNPPELPGEAAPEIPPRSPAYVATPQPARPLLTYGLMAFTTLVYLAQMASTALLGGDYPAALGAKVNALIAAGQWWRLITPVLLHGSLLHIGFNMYALYVLGPELERHFGRGRFLPLYLLGGFAGNVTSMVFSTAPSLGASTAIFGLLGAQGVFIYQNRGLFGQRSRHALQSILTIAAINFFIGLSPGIDNWGHLGGLVGGAAFSWFAGPLLYLDGIYPYYTLRDRRPPANAWLAAGAVGTLFVALAAGVIFWRGALTHAP